ncbi:CYP4M25 protein [Danaus plexippus plexippus]|uniref:CYP4M25 protein n=1 Tax=Danaus plexippus plexippus TaxID=278856 RepID=A0A212F1X5_DANPL|nr:CYP4M25 protein [Danaus plexippus plexippus]
MVYNPQDVEILLSGKKHSSKGFLYNFLRPWLKDGLLLSDGIKWHSRRKILTPTFHFNILRHFNSVLLEKVQAFVERLNSEVGNSATEIFPLITEFSLNSICETAMGTALEDEKCDMGQKYKDSIHTLGTYVFSRSTKFWIYPDFIFNLSSLGMNQKKVLEVISQFRNNVIAKRKLDTNVRQIEDDDCDDEYFISKKQRLAMLDLLLQAEKEGHIDSDGISEEVDTFMFEGHDTVATGLQYIFMLLANHEDIQDKVFLECEEILSRNNGRPSINDMAQMKFLEACIKEALRLYPPVYFISRIGDEPIELSNGHTCPAGTDFNILIYELHRQADQFVEPYKFLPERFLKEPTWHPFSYLPFSAGPRNCIGQKFAMMEMKLLLSKVLTVYRLLPITKPQDIIFYADILLRSNQVKVKIEKRKK